MALEHVQSFLGISQVVVVNTMVWKYIMYNMKTQKDVKAHKSVFSFNILEYHEFHETCHSVTFYFMKKKIIFWYYQEVNLPNMIGAVKYSKKKCVCESHFLLSIQLCSKLFNPPCGFPMISIVNKSCNIECCVKNVFRINKK